MIRPATAGAGPCRAATYGSCSPTVLAPPKARSPWMPAWNTRQRRWQASGYVAPPFQFTDNLQPDTGVHLPVSRRADHEFFVGFALRR